MILLSPLKIRGDEGGVMTLCVAVIPACLPVGRLDRQSRNSPPYFKEGCPERGGVVLTLLFCRGRACSALFSESDFAIEITGADQCPPLQSLLS